MSVPAQRPDSSPDASRRSRPASESARGSTEPVYVGLVTRAIGFVLDAAIIDLVAIVVALGASLILSLLHVPKDLKTVLLALGGLAYILWSIAYFVGFWSTTGQTPGGRMLQFRVVPTGGGTLKPRRALVRVFGLVLAALPLFAGYVLILFDGRRRGLQDRLARTLVVDTRLPSPKLEDDPQTATESDRFRQTTQEQI